MIWAAIAVLVAVPIGVFLIRPRLKGLFNKDFQGIKTEAIVGPIITLAVFLSAFVVAQATQTYQRANQSASAEAQAVALMSENAGMLPNGQGQKIQGDTVCYARAVRFQEWPAMNNHQDSDVATSWAQQFNTEIPAVLNGPSAIVGQVVSLNRTQSEARAARLHESSPHLPVLTLALMIFAIVGVVLLVASFATPDMRRRVLLILSFSIALLLGGVLILVEQLEEPFSGVIQIAPTAMASTQKSITKAYQQAYPGQPIPCDAKGNPN